MAQQAPQSTDNAFIVRVQPHDTVQHQLGDIIAGSFGLTGALVLAAVVSGVVLAGLRIVWRKSRRTFDTDAPPSIGSVPLGSGANFDALAETLTEPSAEAEPKLDQRPDR